MIKSKLQWVAMDNDDVHTIKVIGAKMKSEVNFLVKFNSNL